MTIKKFILRNILFVFILSLTIFSCKNKADTSNFVKENPYINYYPDSCYFIDKYEIIFMEEFGNTDIYVNDKLIESVNIKSDGSHPWSYGISFELSKDTLQQMKIILPTEKKYCEFKLDKKYHFIYVYKGFRINCKENCPIVDE